ncbi:Serine proteinase stubble, partial [Acromyrmex echinatior]
FPWIARLGCIVSPMPGLQWISWMCGGTLINELFILTAAHCFSDDSSLISLIMSYVARVADLNFEDTNDGAKPVQVPIKDIMRHMEYNALTHENDVALVKLAEKVKFTPILLPACLPLGKVKNENLDGMEASIAGWGHTSYEGESPDELLKATISIISEKECKAAYGQSTAVIDNRTLCAESPGKDSCQGDSGGPLTIRFENKTYLVGIVSWGKGCAEPNYPGVYTKVAEFLPFIKQHMGIEDFSY